MIVIVSGEGSTDIGGTDAEGGFTAGPMAALIDRLIEPIWRFSPLESKCFEFLSEQALNQKSKAIDAPALRGKKRKGFETAFFFKNARTLAKYAKELQTREKDISMAVFFRDTDGTRSSKRSVRSDKVSSISHGFIAENYEHGVPMMPKPICEVWLMCGLQDKPYQNCARLERLSGSENALNPPKKKLEQLLAKRNIHSIHETTEMILEAKINAQSIDMPSYNEFKQCLEQVARKLLKF
jgi:hypothetical protein